MIRHHPFWILSLIACIATSAARAEPLSVRLYGTIDAASGWVVFREKNSLKLLPGAVVPDVDSTAVVAELPRDQRSAPGLGEIAGVVLTRDGSVIASPLITEGAVAQESASLRDEAILLRSRRELLLKNRDELKAHLEQLKEQLSQNVATGISNKP